MNEALERGYMFNFYKELVADKLSELIEKSYVKEKYCFKITDMLVDIMIKIGKITLQEADKYFLEQVAKRFKKD